MKKKIIIISHNLRIGGVERALIGLLNSFDYSRYEVDLFLFIHDGEFLPMLPKEVKLLPENKKYASMLMTTPENLKAGLFSTLLTKAIAKFKAKRFVNRQQLDGIENIVYLNYMQKEMLKILPPVSDKDYDLAVSFLTPHYIAAQKSNSKKRIAWIHTDYSYYGMDKEAEFKMWSAYDRIASVSDDCSKGFLKLFPELEPKLIRIHNILNPDTVRMLADEFDPLPEMPTEEDELNLCSIGRFTIQKNFDNVPFIAKLLKEKGGKFKWFLIGYGGDEELINENIKNAGMEETVIMLGKKSNPYPYMKACDIYVQPSRMEGRAVSVTEAQILARPVVITDYPTAPAQLNNGFDGLVVPLDNEGCAAGLYELMNHPEKMKELSDNCSRTDYRNAEEVEKIYSLI